uniref:epoxide hydrolase family protein n=1 Tax=Paractinoplanes polyasparticus TaxID=2856853 RepID=UPI001C8600AB|nr:epoxide hydrolase family protein [Actinoplanes polyasparticus]
MLIQPFTIAVDDEVLTDLRERIARTRWPDSVEGAGWAYGADPAYLRELVIDWGTAFDWRARERELNRLAHFRADVDGLGVHFVHERGRGPRPMPLILTHGWPSSFLEHLEVLPLLTDPAAHGGDPADAFDVVVASLPGYGFSDRPREPGMTKAAIADVWARLMQGLGYDRFGAHGSDVGGGVTVALGRQHPDRLLGLHLSAYTFPAPPEPWTPAERAFAEAQEHWHRTEGAYHAQQATKPQTLAFGLTDSPAGLAAWILEKFRAWSDCGGDLESRFSRDQLLTNLTVYWVTETINSSTRVYYEERQNPSPATAPVPVPAGFAVFPNEFVPEGRPPRELAERTFDVRRWTEHPHGGHFAALEEPAVLAEEIRAFFRPLRAV